MLFKKSEETKQINLLNKPHNGDKRAKFKNQQNVVEIRGVKKTFTNGDLRTEVLKGVDLEIKRGEFVVILGPSGSGKTTLMNIISGLDRATEGEVNVVDSNLINMTDDELTIFRRKNIAYVFQQYGLLPNLKVRENIQIGSFLSKNNQKEKHKKMRKKINEKNFNENLLNTKSKDGDHFFSYLWFLIPLSFIDFHFFLDQYFEIVFDNDWYIDVDEAMRMFNISNLSEKFPSQLSGGQQQRVSIARAICKNAKILFADEPTGAVDEEMSDIILDAFKLINRRFNTTIVIVTHNPQIAELATKVIYFKNGYISKIVKQVPKNNLK